MKGDKKNIFLSVVIPAFNEEKNIRLGVLDKVTRYLETRQYSWEVVIVDDGSTDATGELVSQYVEQNKGFRLITNKHQGKAATVVTGMLDAQGSIVLFTDLDQATPIYELEKLLPWFDKGYEVVIGSRNSRREGAPVHRAIMAKGFSFLRSMILGLHDITDTQCGFKAFKRAASKQIFKKLQLYGTSHEVVGSRVTAGFDIEVLFLANQLNFKIKEVPVEWHYVETRRVNPIVDSFHGLFDIIQIRINSMKGLYDLRT